MEALLERRIEEQNRTQFQTGIVAAAIQNAFRGEGSKPIDPIDYVPDYAERRKKEMTMQESDADRIKAMAAFFGCGPEGIN